MFGPSAGHGPREPRPAGTARRRWVRWAVASVLAWAATLALNRSLQRVDGPSMLPGLWDGDLLLTVPPRLAGGLRRDDVVVASTSAGRLVKRAAGLPGEPVLAGEGHRHAAGRWHRQPSASHPSADRRFFPAADELVLLGDHPAESTDSREFGPVPTSAIRRVALARVRPWARLRASTPRPLDGARRRPTVRVVVLDPDDRVLLFEVSDVDGSGETWWETPGGGMEPGEDHLGTARRELAEEVGHHEVVTLADLHVATERETSMAGAALVKVEHLVAARLDDATVDPSGWTAAEVRDMVTWRWWTREELASTNAPIVPTGLADLLDEARRALG